MRHLRFGHDLAARARCGSPGSSTRAATSPIDGSSDRVRRGETGLEYVVAWASEIGRRHRRHRAGTRPTSRTCCGRRRAIYAGATVLCDSVGVTMADVERVLDRRRLRPPHRRGEGHPHRPLPGPPLGALLLPGQHLPAGGLSGPHLPRAPHPSGRTGRQDDLPGAERRQSLHGRVHVCAVHPPYRRELCSRRWDRHWRRSGRKESVRR